MILNNNTGWVTTILIDPPSLNDNTAYIDRVTEILKRKFQVDNIHINLQLLRKIPELIRKWKYKARCVIFKNGSNNCTLVHIANPKEKKPIAGVAIDLGTSRIVIRIVNLINGLIIGEKVFDNPQIDVGLDVLTRIHHSNTDEGLEYLNKLIINSLNLHINNLCYKHNIVSDNIYIVSVAGNTIMTHLFLKISPEYISKEPYTPSINTPEVIHSREIGIRVNPNAQAFIFPNVGSYFGGDLIAGILYSGLSKKKTVSILVDIGTNAEIVLGNSEWMIACAGAAGPALEGSVTHVGTMAGPGIIDSVRINSTSKKIVLNTINNMPPKGICGSGIIDLVAQLFISGLIDLQGKFLTNVLPKLFIKKNNSTHMILVPSNQSADGNTITIAQEDITSLIRSKAAMYTLLETITNTAGIDQNAINTFFIAGTFGLYINPKSAITIGMLPDIPLNLYKPIGNSSLGGATMLLQCVDAFDKINLIRNNITYMELNVNQPFMNRFSAAKFLPHTDIARFPTCKNNRNL